MNNIGRTMLIACCAGLLWSPMASGADRARRAQVEQLMDLLQIEEAATMAAVELIAQFVSSDPDWLIHEDILLNYAEEQVGWPVLEPAVAKIFLDLFTEQEVRDLLRFYRSSAGRKLMAVTPRITQRIGALVQSQFEEELGLLELRMKHRELERLEQDNVFISEENGP